MKKQIKAFIKEDTKEKGGLWLVVERPKETESTAHPIFKDEVVVIMEACKIYSEGVK